MGGVNIEEVAQDHPSAIYKTPIDVKEGLPMGMFTVW